MVEIRVPGDKSIAHRALILASLANGASRVRGLPAADDVKATAAALRALGVMIRAATPGCATIEGPARWRPPGEPLDCGNSATTARLLTGLIAGLGLRAELTGDASLRRRPMDRVVYPLQAMGARIRYLQEPGRLPLRVERRASGSLRPLRHRSRFSSAQVKSALLLAALAGRVELEVQDRGCSRDHTERLLRHMGVPVRSDTAQPGDHLHFTPDAWDGRMRALDLEVPGDLSSASFLVGAALLGRRKLVIRDVGLNPSRAGFVDVLREMGCPLRTTLTGTAGGEPVGDLAVPLSELRGFSFGGPIVPRLIDEIPLLAVLAARAAGVSEFRDAGDLRVKESDRLGLLATNLRRIGVHCESKGDGLRIHGTAEELSGAVRTGGDHRMAMAFGVLGRAPGVRLKIDDVGCVAVSYPEFWDVLDRVFPEG